MVSDEENDYSEEQEAVFDWKKKGFDNQERLTLKHNVREAEEYNQQKKDQPLKAYKPNPQNLPNGLKKLRKKIREVFDEEDDDENETIFAPVPMLQEEDNELLNALTDDEKKLFIQKNTMKNVQMQQSAGKLEALHIANSLAREAGLRNISRKAMEIGMQEAVFRPETTQQKIVTQEVTGKLGIKGRLEEGKVVQAARGIKKVEQLGGKQAAKNLDMRDIIKAGEDKLDEIKLAELILEKSGQDVKKRKEKLRTGKQNIQLKNFEKNKEKDKSSSPKKKNLTLNGR